MAMLFDDAAEDYLERDETPVTTPPFTMACWAQTDDVNTYEVMMSMANKDAAYDRHMLWLSNRTGDPVEAYTSNSGGGNYATTTSGITANQPFHACGVWISDNERHAYINGGSEGVNNNSRSASGINRVSIGRLGDSTPGSYWSGKIWEAAIWNVALADEEVAILARGFSPLFVRPQDLVAYWPLHRRHNYEYPPGKVDIVGRYHFTNASGYPSDVDHGKIIYPAGISIETLIKAGIVRPLISGSLAAGRKGLVA